MPIALLLQDALSPLTNAEVVLARWQAMVRLEALVVARARGAFVVHWFGVGLAAVGGRLLVGIQNIQALTVQYRQARAASVAGDTGPNLLEPLASLAGMGVGMFLSPSGAVLTLFAILRRDLGRIIGVLLTIVYSPHMIALMTGIGGGVLIGVGLPVALLVGIGYALYVAFSGDDIVERFELLGDVTRMITAFTRFINLLTVRARRCATRCWRCSAWRRHRGVDGASAWRRGIPAGAAGCRSSRRISGSSPCCATSASPRPI